MDKYLVLVNKENKFDPSVLKDFKMVSAKDLDGDSVLEEETFKALTALASYMKDKHGIIVTNTSLTRTEQQQKETMEYFIKKEGEQAAKERVALPGFSEHHTGLAADVGVERISSVEQKIYNKIPVLKKVVRKIKSLTNEEKELYDILHKELAQFGFILRYPDDKKEETGIKRSEPWHVRYVGVENAKEMQALGMCLEEYVTYLKEQELSL